MKRINNIYQNICSVQNLQLANLNARKGKLFQYGVQVFDKNPEGNINAIHKSLVDQSYTTSKYSVFKIFEPKEREVYRLPYCPDRIVHHAAMLQLESIFNNLFTADTYSCIKGRGVHGAANALTKALQNMELTKYCLKLDIKKFYPSVDHQILKELLHRKFKDADLLNFLFEIINSAQGLPIGNYLSQYFANFYLTPFDHWIKEKMKALHYFRYMDDMVILSASKSYLQNLLTEIKIYLSERLRLTVKSNYQVFPVEARGIDFVGYKFFHTHTLLRKSIKKSFARMVARNCNDASIASYYGWAKHCNSKNLLKKLLNETV